MRAFLLLFLVFVSCHDFDYTEEVHLAQGRIRGKRLTQNFHGKEMSGDEYLGIPFASPPVGNLRWASPQPPKGWDGVRDAVNYAPGCVQTCLLPHVDGACPKNQSEDCLYLNIWTPQSAAAQVQKGMAPFPVMFWIHGGAFTEGTASCPAFYGLFLQNITNQVIVTINYRLAALGFLMTDTITGNFGIEDQRIAMQWVKANIAQFGGNPNSITIFGESAGAMSVSSHLVSPLSSGLFQKALMESNPVSEYSTAAETLDSSNMFCKNVGCDCSNTTCLLALSAETIRGGSGGIWQVTIDGPGGNLPDIPLNMFKAGNYNKVPTVLGTNKHEAAIFLSYGFEKPMDVTEYENVIRINFPKTYKQVLELYPPQENYDNRITYAYLLTHENWACPGAQIVLSINKFNPSGDAAFLYYFEHIFSIPVWHEPICEEAVCHAEELGFVWNTTTFVSQGLLNPTPQEITLSETMMRYWGQFSATGNPTLSSQVTWPAFVVQSNISMVLDIPNVYTSPGHLQVYCNFWDNQ